MKLFITDLDGTLLTTEGTLSTRSRQGLEEILAAGVHFTIATARSVFSMKDILGSDIPFTLPVVAFNGAFVSCFHTGSHHVVHHLSKEHCHTLYQMILDFNLKPFISTYAGEDKLYHDTIINEGMQWYKDDRLTRGDSRLRDSFCIDSIFAEQVVCINTIARKEELIPLARAIEATFGDTVTIHFFENHYSPGWYWLTAHDTDATKASGCRWLCEHLSLTPEDITVFGDNNNDISMFQLAGKSVAVDNATPELKKHADIVIDSNDSDAVIDYILSEL